MPKLRPRFPQLKLRGKIVAAAALVFTVAIAASLLFVLTSSRQKDLATADREIRALADNRAADIRLRVDQYSTVAKATANAAEAIVANPAAALSLMGEVVMKQARMVPDSLGVIVMLTPDAGISGRPDFMVSGFGYQDHYFGAYAQLQGAGKEPVFSTLEDKTGAGYAWTSGDNSFVWEVAVGTEFQVKPKTTVTPYVQYTDAPDLAGDGTWTFGAKGNYWVNSQWSVTAGVELSDEKDVRFTVGTNFRF